MVAMNTSFFGELLQSITDRGRSLMERRRSPTAHSESLIGGCEELLSGRGEASGVALAREILTRYSQSPVQPRVAFFEALASRFGPDRKRLERAVAAWQQDPTDANARELHEASEPRRQELFRRLNLAPAGTAALVAIRDQLLDALPERPDLNVVDNDFVHLFSSWFNRGFLVLRRIDWSTPAIILEKIIRYEAVHEIRDWEDLRRRIDPPDRRCYAFFHPALVDEPLIFVEVTLTREMPAAISPILAQDRDIMDPERATTATFYSISNCQRGLSGVTFGHFLIKQVAEEISRELPALTTFVTLSPVSGFADWVAAERDNPNSTIFDSRDRAVLVGLDGIEWWLDEDVADALREPLLRAAAYYFLAARTARGTPRDSVARFHLGNGARLERINWLADTSPKGIRQSLGIMVNYLYDLDEIEKNHEAYAETRTIVASSAVRRLAHVPLELTPAAG
ncbi:MAG: malonyl-CoA decarboxylase [Variibacter sp.]|jgi:malonyl-CoA decarboxylase|nr:malonyl-CoA decarboxylase [Variibacter sp.]